MIRPLLRPPRAVLALLIVLAGLAAPGNGFASGNPQDVLDQTARIRELRPRAAVPVVFQDRAQFRRGLLKSFEGEQAIREVELSRKLLVLLGLLGPDADLYGMLLELNSGTICAYYDYDDRTMYLLEGQSAAQPKEILSLAHEFTHALQDQYFDLDELQSSASDNEDRARAALALIEGDATLTSALYASQFLD